MSPSHPLPLLAEASLHTDLSLFICLQLLIALKAVDVGYGLVYHHLDKVYLHSILFNSEKRRLAFERDTSNKERETTLGSPIRRVSFLGIGVGAGLIITTFTVCQSPVSLSSSAFVGLV